MNEMMAKMKDIQDKFLKYIDEKDDIEENYHNFKVIFDDQQIIDKYLLVVLHFISQIANNHYRQIDFISKIKRILQLFKPYIKQKFINSIIFHIFKYNKMILLFLIKEDMLSVDAYIVQQMMNKKYKKMRYSQYFYPEIQSLLPSIKKIDNKKKSSFLTDTDDDDIEFKEGLPEKFEEKRQIGENDDYFSQLIRNDQIDKFITYYNKNDISPKACIDLSIYETNLLILKNSKIKKSIFSKEQRIMPSLIEYATFYGSVQIFKYLENNGAELAPSLWIYAVHSDTPEIIHNLEEKGIKPENDSYEKVFVESIKCHHNDIANYIRDNYLNDEKSESNFHFLKALKYYNFQFIENDSIDQSFFYNLCQYDYYPFVKEIMETKNFDINEIKKSSLKDDGHFHAKKELKEEKTALHTAIENDNYEIVKLLLLNDQIDVNLESYIQKPKIDKIACDNEWDDWEEWDDNITKNISPLIFSIEKGNNDIIKLLLYNKKIDVNHKCKFFRRLLDDGGIDQAEISPLYCAIKYENIEIIKILLSNEKIEHDSIIHFIFFNPDGNGKTKCELYRTPLHFAVEKGNIEIVKLLVETGKVDINKQKSYLYFSDEHEEWSIMTEKSTTTPLTIAIKRKEVEIVDYLLSLDKIDANCLYFYEHAYVNYDDSDPWSDNRIKNIDDSFYVYSPENVSENEDKITKMSPLHLAIESKNMDLIKLLLSCDKVDVNIIKEYHHRQYFSENDNQNDFNEEADLKIPTLCVAIKIGDIEIVKLLVSNDKIDVNINYSGTTHPCIFDSENNSDKILASAKNFSCAPLTYAFSEKKTEIAYYLAFKLKFK